MKVDKKDLSRGQAELTIELSVEEYQPFLKTAASAISERVKISGFRDGKAPYDMIKQQVGEARIWEEALEKAVAKTLYQALDEHKLLTVGSPKIDVVKLAPNNPVIYTAAVSLLPTIQNLVHEDVKIEQKKVEVPEEKSEKTLNDLLKMRATEKLVERAAKSGDKVEIDFTIYLDKVPIENGSHKKFPITIGDGSFIPGFEENILGMKRGETKEFLLAMPKEFHQKNIAGKKVDIKATILSVFEVTLPEANDDFSMTLGFSDVKELKKHIHSSLVRDAEIAARREWEEKLLDALIEKNNFSDVPDVLIQNESQKMIHELEHQITSCTRF